MSSTWNSSRQRSRASAASARGDRRYRIVAARLAAFQALAEVVDPLVHVGHEVVEVGAAPGRDVDALHEQVDQHGLAAADVAMDVEAARRGEVAAAEEARQGAAGPGPPAILDGAPELRQPPREQGLGRVVVDRAGRYEGGVAVLGGREHHLKASSTGTWRAFTRRLVSLAMPTTAISSISISSVMPLARAAVVWERMQYSQPFEAEIAT